MSAARVAMIALAALAIGGFAALQTVATAMGDFTGFQFGPDGPDDDQLRAMAWYELGYSVALPGLGTLAVASAFALAVVGARVLARRWLEGDRHEADDRLADELFAADPAAADPAAADPFGRG